MVELVDNVKFIAGSSGTVDFIEPASAVAGFLLLSEAGVGGERYRYTARVGTQFESGSGVFAWPPSGSSSVGRDAVSSSSNGGAKVDFSSAPTVFVTALKADFPVNKDYGSWTGPINDFNDLGNWT